MLKIKYFFFIIIFIFFSGISNSIADTKSKIINNLSSIETLEFEFNQIAFGKEENGKCFLRRPHFLKCEYFNSKSQKELIINKKRLVINHKRYGKTYHFPVSKSYFVDILNKEKFKDLVEKANLELNKNLYEIKYLAEAKGEIMFFFNKKSFDLIGWEIVDVSGNHTRIEIKNLNKNQIIEKKLFYIGEVN